MRESWDAMYMTLVAEIYPELAPAETRSVRTDENPYVWMLSANGLIMDIRYAPRAAQEEAPRKGLIPYLPKERT